MQPFMPADPFLLAFGRYCLIGVVRQRLARRRQQEHLLRLAHPAGLVKGNAPVQPERLGAEIVDQPVDDIQHSARRTEGLGKVKLVKPSARLADLTVEQLPLLTTPAQIVEIGRGSGGERVSRTVKDPWIAE